MAATMIRKIQRKMINAAPMALAVVGMSYFLLSGHDGSRNDSSPLPAPSITKRAVGTKSPESESLAKSHSTDNGNDAPELPNASMASTDHPAAQDNSRIPAPAQKLAPPERLVIANVTDYGDQDIAELEQRAVQGANSDDKIAALMSLAATAKLDVLDTLSEALFDRDPRVGVAAVTAATRLARAKGDEDGRIRQWLIESGNNSDPHIADRARTAANELSQHYGEPPPFPRKGG